jgi:hypothetical protein
MAEGTLPSVLMFVQVVSVVVAAAVSILSFNQTRLKEAEARKIEAAKPFFELRQKLYTETLNQAAILSNPDTHTAVELEAAKKRFRELYVAELSMVEAPGVEAKMKDFANAVDPELVNMTVEQTAAYHLSHALRDSFASSYGVESVASSPPDGAK